jgi:hypothetical protein
MKWRIWLPIALLLLASLACSVFGNAEKAIEVGKEAATKASEMATTVGEEGIATLVPEFSEEGEGTEEPPDEETSEEAAQSEVDAEALTNLDSYRARFVAEWRPEEGEPEVFGFEEARTRNPNARRMIMEGMAEGESFEFVQIEDKSWMCSGGTCTQMAADPEELASGFSDAVMFDPSDVTDDANATFEGRERKRGYQTRHYTLDLTPMQAAFLSQGEVSDLEGEAWIADEPDLPAFAVRFEMSWTEKRESITGQAAFVYETYDVNAPFTIEPPQWADSSGLPEDVPIYPGAEVSFSTEGMTAFNAADGVSDVADFYREALSAEGWTMESDDEMGSMVQQTWKKGERTLTLLVSSEDGGSSGMITIEGGS